jgi:(E)-4-hydroxy-3-methylbut-2-enyl-diphosphate synthase
MRIGTNHGSLSDRIMSRFGDSPMGMVESAMEFLRIARDEQYHQIILSMKSSNPLVMVQAYRLLVQKMATEFGECYPLHLGVTEAGDGEDGRIKSAIGICSLLEDGIGDTIRVSLTEDPEFEVPVCKDIVARYAGACQLQPATDDARRPLEISTEKISWDPFHCQRRQAVAVGNTGAAQVPVVIAAMSKINLTDAAQLQPVGYSYDAASDKWNIGDMAADYIYTGDTVPTFALPGTVQLVSSYSCWQQHKKQTIPYLQPGEYTTNHQEVANITHFVGITSQSLTTELTALLKNDANAILVAEHGLPALQHQEQPFTAPLQALRGLCGTLVAHGINNPVVLKVTSNNTTVDKQLITFATEAGGTLLDGFGDGIWLENHEADIANTQITGRTYLPVSNNAQFLNNTAFSILQATRTRISKTEYISCPSCGRTLFDLQETTAKIRAATNHLKGVKIAIMGCIVNGPGEMADADFGYVGSGPGKITLYKGKEVVKKNVASETAVAELIELLKENEAWVDIN